MRPATAAPPAGASLRCSVLLVGWNGMELTCAWFAFLHWTRGFSQPLHQSGNQEPACPNDDDSLRTTATVAIEEILRLTFSCPGTCALRMGGASESKHHRRTLATWMRRLLQSGQPTHARNGEDRSLLLCDRFLRIFSCAWTTSVVDLRIS